MHQAGSRDESGRTHRRVGALGTPIQHGLYIVDPLVRPESRLWTIAIVRTAASARANPREQAFLRLLELLGRYSAGTVEFCELSEFG